MRSTQTCPKCAGKKFAVSAELQVPDPSSSNGVFVLPGVTIRAGLWSRETAGKFETWICVRCGYTELYAHGEGDLEALAAQFPEQLRIVDATVPAQGPYR